MHSFFIFYFIWWGEDGSSSSSLIMPDSGPICHVYSAGTKQRGWAAPITPPLPPPPPPNPNPINGTLVLSREVFLTHAHTPLGPSLIALRHHVNPPVWPGVTPGSCLSFRLTTKYSFYIFFIRAIIFFLNSVLIVFLFRCFSKTRCVRVCVCVCVCACVCVCVWLVGVVMLCSGNQRAALWICINKGQEYLNQNHAW